jgi:hypothetical protein
VALLTGAVPYVIICKETKADVKGFPANVKSIELIKDRPVLLEKDQQIIRLNNWETISSK